MNKKTLQNIAVLIGFSVVLACIMYITSLWIFSFYKQISLRDALFLEGIIFIFLGVVFFLGSGGINRGSRSASFLAAAARAVYGEKVIGPSEILRRDAWKPKGFIRLALILVITGIILLITYFVSV